MPGVAGRVAARARRRGRYRQRARARAGPPGASAGQRGQCQRRRQPAPRARAGFASLHRARRCARALTRARTWRASRRAEGKRLRGL